MRNLLVALALTGLLGGCTQTQPVPVSNTKSTEVRTNNNSEKTVEVARPVNVQVVSPPAQTSKTTTRVETVPAQTTTEVKEHSQASPSPVASASPSVEPSSEGYTETAESVTVGGSKITKSVDGKKRRVDVQGDENDITVSGSSSSVSVSGNNNHVNVANAKTIDVNGTGNTLSYAGNPTVTNNGTGNEIAKQ